MTTHKSDRDIEYARIMRMRFPLVAFRRCDNCDAVALRRNVETGEIRCETCFYVQRGPTQHSAHVASVSISECNYDAASIAERIVARARAYR